MFAEKPYSERFFPRVENRPVNKTRLARLPRCHDDDSSAHRPQDEAQEPALPQMRLQAEPFAEALQEVRSETVKLGRFG
ncbi:MAG TPA: hypothetical protein VN699_21680 [Pirellulales bacterium]|nr:hypothetical protein [Pirellulales bacterium]